MAEESWGELARGKLARIDESNPMELLQVIAELLVLLVCAVEEQGKGGD